MNDIEAFDISLSLAEMANDLGLTVQTDINNASSMNDACRFIIKKGEKIETAKTLKELHSFLIGYAFEKDNQVS